MSYRSQWGKQNKTSNTRLLFSLQTGSQQTTEYIREIVKLKSRTLNDDAFANKKKKDRKQTVCNYTRQHRKLKTLKYKFDKKRGDIVLTKC